MYCLFHQNMGVLYLTNFTQKFRNILEMNDFGKFVENLHKMTNFEKSPKSPQIDHYFFVRIFKKKKTLTKFSSKNFDIFFQNQTICCKEGKVDKKCP